MPFLWNGYGKRTICYQLDGSEELSEVRDYMLYIILNSEHNDKEAIIPRPKNFKAWYRVIDTGLKSGEDFLESGKEIILPPNNKYLVKSRSAVVFIAKH